MKDGLETGTTRCVLQPSDERSISYQLTIQTGWLPSYWTAFSIDKSLSSAFLLSSSAKASAREGNVIMRRNEV